MRHWWNQNAHPRRREGEREVEWWSRSKRRRLPRRSSKSSLPLFWLLSAAAESFPGGLCQERGRTVDHGEEGGSVVVVLEEEEEEKGRVKGIFRKGEVKKKKGGGDDELGEFGKLASLPSENSKRKN